jgi:hypothetical protein
MRTPFVEISFAVNFVATDSINVITTANQHNASHWTASSSSENKSIFHQ